MDGQPPSLLLFGELRREFIITPSGRTIIDQPGGNLLHSAYGMLLWGERPGLVARVGDDYPRDWLDRLSQAGCNVEGVRILPEKHDLRIFTAYQDFERREHTDPIKHFARLSQPFPKALLGYRASDNGGGSKRKRTPLSLRPEDIPHSYHYALAAHLCPMDYASQNHIPAFLREIGFNTISLDPSPAILDPASQDNFLALLPGLSALIVSEGGLRALFQRRGADVWEMASALSEFGPELVVIKCGQNGQLLFDAESGAKYRVPAYPARVADPTGVGDAFCGGFLAGFRKTYDPVQAVLHGNISASISIEGSDILPIDEGRARLAAARLDSLMEQVRRL